MNKKFGPKSQSLIDEFKGLGVVGRQPNALPPFVRHVRPFDGFHVKVQAAGCGVSSNGGVSRVGQGTATAIAESGNIVFVPAEVLVLSGSTVHN
jgi:hypothetical protein